ncbi:uncharacterized protein FIESC28_07543 [Fusarium coffeatum]|uniref:Uncharacterized protein n=1 Tax=Fusarium coffeatum TaxID=231269 RepID=A0A366RF33_9HYPO|nr:uncharacterized protein FIESC28_07543 [Fusarium coffeatum]RBR14845.1 hypothetical protein FIESC28_07543 [Fusarium coffeatum]
MVPDNLTLSKTYANPELDALRTIASISGCISDRDRMRQDTPFSTITRMVEEIRQLKVLIPDERNDSVFAHPITYAILRLFKHTLNTMIHLPYSQFAASDKQFEYTRVEVLESAEGAIRAHQDMRDMQDTVAKCHLYDFLAFNAAVILVTDLAAKETPRSAEEEERIWTVITELVSRLRKTGESLESATAEQAAEVLENLHRACKGIYRGHEFHRQIALLGKVQISRATEQHGDVEASTTTVLLETNTYTFRVPDEHLTEKELADDWSAQTTLDLKYGWRGSPPKGLDQPIPDPFTRLDRGTYLHDRPEKDVYKLLIDTYRLRVEDMYRLEGEVEQDSLYSGASDGLAGFKKFLRKVSTQKGLLPPWWTPEKRKECEEFGMTSSEPSLKTGVEKADIIEHYGDSQFPMQLRMLGECKKI